jgi:hypothetical protein
MFIMVSAMLFYNVQGVKGKTYKWFKQGLSSVLAVAAYCPVSVLFFLQQFYGDVNRTSLRNEWQERLVFATILVVCSFLVMLVLNVVMAKREANYKWQKEGLISAVIITFCYFQAMNIFIRTH